MKTTEREQMLMLAKLMSKVNKSNNWTLDQFQKCATSVCVKESPASRECRLKKSEASRFYAYLQEHDYLRPAADKRKNNPNFDSKIWTNEDVRMDWLRNVVQYSNIFQNPGRKPGQKVSKKEPNLLEDVEISPNPQRMEDDVLDGYNEVTGEWDRLPEVAVEAVKEERNPLYAIMDQIDPFIIIAYLKEKASNKGLDITIKLK